MDREMTEREAFVDWLSDDSKSGPFPTMEQCWQAACKWQRERDAEIFAKVEVMRYATNQGSKE